MRPVEQGAARAAARAGARRVDRVVARLAETASQEVPDDVRVSREGDDVVLTGRGLRARAMDNARLRGIGMLAKGSGG